MDNFTMGELKELTSRHTDLCVSLYLPTHRAGRDTEQDPIRFKNLLRDVEERLLSNGLREPDVERMLAPAKDLLNAPEFWRHQSDGLALFFSSGEIHTYRLPIRFGEFVVVSDRFHLKPLLQYLANDGHFYILALSQNQVRLLEGTRHTVDEIPAENIPESMSDALQSERFEKQIQFHTGTSMTTGGGKRSAVFHGHDPSEEDKERLQRWFRKIDEELIKLLGDERSPLILAGVDYYFPIYRSVSAYPNVLENGLPGNPDASRPEELHAGVWPLVEPLFMKNQENAFNRYHERTAQGNTTSDVRETVLAAFHGRVDTLFVPVGVQVWGRLDQEAGVVSVHPDRVTGDEDLLDLAAIQTLTNGGDVFAVSPDEMPASAPLAAILRY